MTRSSPQPVPSGDRDSIMLKEVLVGLSGPEKHLPSKYFYDASGSELFEQICELPEYYVTRTELAIMADSIDDIAVALGPRVRFVEYGSGSSTKIQLLLDHLDSPTSYVPVEISEDMLARATAALRQQYPRLLIEPRCVDYTRPFALPPPPAGTLRTVCYYPGSTIGNFTRPAAEAFLRNIASVCGRDGGLLIGVDLQKSTEVLLPAYNDSSGLTAAFNKNMLLHLNDTLGTDFDPEAFEHRAIWNGAESRIEMQLVSLRDQTVRVGGHSVRFRRGEVLTTEYSHKHTLETFAAMSARAGFGVERVWQDARRWFSVQLLRCSG